MIVRTATDADIIAVVTAMREQSAAEAFASRAEQNHFHLANDLRAAARATLLLRTLALDDGLAVALVGVAWIGPGRAGIMFLANDHFPRISVSTQRWFCRSFMPGVLTKFRRVEFTGSTPDSASGRWLASLGFVCEGVARAYGKNGEDFGHWAWINPAWPPTVDVSPAPLGSPGRHQDGSAHV